MVNESFIWTEKYRPSKFDELVGQTEIVRRIQALVKANNLPHLLFAGPPGVGKSTLALVIVKELFGENWRDNFLELNASDERGIDVIRQKVKDFARTRSIGNVAFKIIFLDESDALTKEAQQALRRTMENYTSATRFILSCNYSSKIIDPIQSRTAVFRFKPLTKTEVYSLVDSISSRENLSIDDEAKDALFYVSGGDCRRVTNILQSSSAINKNITAKSIFDIASYAEPKEVREILSLCIKGDFSSAKKLLLDTMLNQGLSGFDIIKQFQKEAWNLEVADVVKLKTVKLCGDCEFRLVEGSDEFVQLEAMLAKMVLLFNRHE